MNTVWVVQEEIPVALQIVPLDVKIFSTEEKARAYFIRELDSLKNYYDSPEADFVMPPDIAERSEEELAEVRDKNNDGDRDDIENYIDNDEELKKAKQDERLVLENNNWDEMLVSMDGGEQWTNQNNIGDTGDVISDVWLHADLFEYLTDLLEAA